MKSYGKEKYIFFSFLSKELFGAQSSGTPPPQSGIWVKDEILFKVSCGLHRFVYKHLYFYFPKYLFP